MMRGFLTFCCVSRSEVFAKNVSAFAWRPRRQLRLSHINYCFFSSKPASTVFPPKIAKIARVGFILLSCWVASRNRVNLCCDHTL
jgi:hypothetical protein